MEYNLSKFTLEVLDHLSPTEWKTPNEIRSQIKEQRRKEGKRTYFALFLWIRVWNTLTELEDQGLAQVRRRAGTKKGDFERRLTSRGHRFKAALPRKSEADEGVFNPAHI